MGSLSSVSRLPFSLVPKKPWIKLKPKISKMEGVFLILLLVAFLNTYTIRAVPTYIDHVCINNVTYTSNSTYEENLNTTLSSLLATSSPLAIATGHAYATTAQNTSDRVYGEYVCRADVSPAVCRDCVKTAAEEITQRCPGERVSTIWYDECMLRYSNFYIPDIYGSYEESTCVITSNKNNVTDPDRFGQLVRETIDQVILKAAYIETGKKYAVWKAKFTSFRTLYMLAQCTPDLVDVICDMCLRAIRARLQLDKEGEGYYCPSCMVRFELHPFYNESAVPAPPPPSSPVQPPSRARSPLVPVTSKGRKDFTVTIIVIIATIAIGVMLILIGCCFIQRKEPTKRTDEMQDKSDDTSSINSLQFDFKQIQVATNNFSYDNKLGQGGFGVVYKGTLSNGQTVAVKRLSCSFGHGADEFKTEVEVVAKLQHKNLARLIGFCLQGEEKLLVYEFMPNKSLDYFLFDPQKQILLDWSQRYKILMGVAKGVLYLHEDSRLRIIHRDLKASNVLLDNEMNPKVSDFGVAKIIGADETQGKTNRIVGTYGYMAPEYARYGRFSTKTDVYSYGVLLLEMICGKRNNFLCQSDRVENLPTYAWKQWKNGMPLEVVDPLLGDSFERSEVIRCIYIGLLCVQENPSSRPTMAAVLHMLDDKNMSMALPRQPAFFFSSKAKAMDMINPKTSSSEQSTSTPTFLSVNDVSITKLYPR